jgi:hypothetical protein
MLTYWRAQRLEVPVRVQHGESLLRKPSLLAMVGALGGTATTNGHGVISITLDGQTHRYQCQVHQALADIPLRQLAHDFDLLLSWNAPAADVVVNDSHASRIIVLHASGSRGYMKWPPWRT